MSLFTVRRVALVLVWAASMAVAAAGGAWVFKNRDRIARRLGRGQANQIIEANLYNLRVRKINLNALGRDGGITGLGDGVLFANRRGATWFIGRDGQPRALALRIPINLDAFEQDTFSAAATQQDRFAVKDLLVMPLANGVRLLASYMWWNSADRCNTLRVSSVEGTIEQLTADAAASPLPWRTVFESHPCMPLVQAPGAPHRNVTLGAGGRLAALSDHEILVSLGSFGPEAGILSNDAYWDTANVYGKTVRVDLGTGASRVFTIGHRNPQGLAIGSDGRAWLTEHAARGGDELNLLREGANYGYPAVSYGTAYENTVWPANPRQGRHDGYERPLFAWVPSIGISQLIVLEGDGFPWWQGDLIVSALHGRSIYRVHIEDGRAVVVEQILIDHRIRDIAETGHGSIALKTDDNLLILLSRVDTASAASLDPAQRGQLLAGTCRSCHAVERDAPAGIGPNLFGVVGRQVAAQPGFAYSDALRRAGGRWSEDRLRRFIVRPDSVAPGTSMQVTSTYTAEQLSDLVTYLRTLR